MGEQSAGCLGGWLGKLHNSWRETRMGIGCLSGLSAQFPKLAKQARSVAFMQFLKGVSLGVTTLSNSLIDQQDGWLISLQAAQIEMACWILLRCSG